MLDRLLGRASLKERIAELEDERQSLQAQLDAERERRADAVADRQTAEERVNRLEDRIADLEGKVDGDDSTAAESTARSFRRRERVVGDRATAVFDRLDGVRTGPEGALTVALDGGGTPAALSDVLGDRATLAERVAPCVVVADDAGLVAAALDVPVQPTPFAAWSDGFELERSWIEPTGSFGLALVRSDTFAYGSYEGTERVAFEGFESDVTADHSKGGFSQARFERRRDEEIADHLDRCEAALSDREDDHNRLYVVGEERLLSRFEGSAEATATADATGDPEPALADAFRDFWTTTVHGL
ncbi:MAG: Vms1/Ankzf1 family peptidyl-tRNA hydrolase [Halolamina sp.]